MSALFSRAATRDVMRSLPGTPFDHFVRVRVPDRSRETARMIHQCDCIPGATIRLVGGEAALYLNGSLISKGPCIRALTDVGFIRRTLIIEGWLRITVFLGSCSQCQTVFWD